MLRWNPLHKDWLMPAAVNPKARLTQPKLTQTNHAALQSQGLKFAIPENHCLRSVDLMISGCWNAPQSLTNSITTINCAESANRQWFHLAMRTSAGGSNLHNTLSGIWQQWDWTKNINLLAIPYRSSPSTFFLPQTMCLQTLATEIGSFWNVKFESLANHSKD